MPADDRAQRSTLLDALILVRCLVAAMGWAGVAWRLEPWALPAQGLWRASGTMTYANAAAGLLVPLALVALARVIDHSRSSLRAVAACLLLTGAVATLSRAGMINKCVAGVKDSLALGLLNEALGTRSVPVALVPSVNTSLAGHPA